MKKTLVLAVVGLVTSLFAAGDPLLEGFRTPPHAAKPHVWWHWMNGNVSKAGITADLEAMAKAGIGGAQIFDVSDGIPAGRVAFNSDLWFEMLKHANEEAKRLGIELCLANCSGWSSSGGPWVKPEDAEKDVVFAETVVKGGASFNGKLPCAANPHGFYRDLKVLAFPRPAAERIDPKAYGAKTEIKGDGATISFAQPFPLSGVAVSLEGGGRHPTSKVSVEVDCGAGFKSAVTNFQVYPTRYGFTDERLFVPVVAKNARGIRVTCKSTPGVTLTAAIPEARGRIVEEWAKTFVIRSRIVGHANPVAPELTIDPNQILDLTSALGADGTFHWTAPADVEEWVIVRFGYAANGTRNRPPTPGGDGLEVDKFSKAALGRFFTEGYVDKALRILGPVDPRGGVNALIVDSFEVKSQNWTDGFERIFAARKHYDLTKFLPVFTGRIVGSTEKTDAFLADFRSVASALFIENYAAEFHRLCQARGLQFYLEGYGSAPCDDLRYERHCDVPMGEYWAKTNLRTGNCRFAGSVAHVWGHRFVAAESFTTAENGRWTRDPFAYKAQGDRAFCAGINRIIYHRWAHQPWTNPANAPGMTMGPHGSHFERTQTWWNDAAAAWLTYQARCQWMLQQGVAASDLLVVAPKGTPSCGLDLSRWHEYESVSGDRFGRGIQWDLCDEEALAASKVVNGKTVTPSGAAYAQVMRLSRDKAPHIEPDFDCTDESIYRDLGWIHRRTTSNDDIYFVALPNTEEKTFEVSFRGTGRHPEIWDPETGTVAEPIAWRTEKGRTFVTLTFKPSGAAFVVFRASPTSSLEQVPKPSSVSQTIPVAGPWQVQFLNGRGAPATPVEFPHLQPWNEHTNPGIRFYSGSAVYSKTIHITDDLFKHSNLETFKQSSSENHILLDLGDVKNVAVVTVNGTVYPVLWRPPFRLDITDAVKQAINSNLKTISLSIRLTNLWPNRLIGDDALPCDAEYRAQNDPVDARNLKGGIVSIPERLWREEPSPTGRHTFTTWRHWTKDDKLFPSGLLGPVKLIVSEPTIELPGEKQTVAPIPCAPFPDRISAYVWRNWFLVPHDRLAATVGATEDDLTWIATEMGLPANVDVLPQWRRRGYITVLRRNWHLLDYPQLLQLLDMSRKELYFSLQEDDFLWHKMGKIKPHCGELKYESGTPESAAARRRIAQILHEEGIDDFSEEPRFSFIEDLKRVEQPATMGGTRSVASAAVPAKSPFDLRLIFSYFADYGDPLADPEIGSYPEGLLQKLAAQGVNAVWLHTVLNTLAKDPKYPEFGMGSERRMANLRTLVARAAKYGIRVYLYMNEPRAQPPAFFEQPGRAEMKGTWQDGDGTFAMCTSSPETLRWVRDAVKSVFTAVPGLGGIFTITMSENLTNCASRGRKDRCPRCKDRRTEELISEVNRALIEGMHAGSPTAEALVWNWAWPDALESEVLAGLPKEHCRVMTISEGKMDICRGGVKVRTHDYSISCVGPSPKACTFWEESKRLGLKTAAKVQANTTWEISSVPYLPVMDLVARQASNLVKQGVDGVMLSWSLGCAPAPNLRVYNEIGADGDVDAVLNRIAADVYGAEAVPAVRRAWTSFSNGFENFPFSIGVAYNGPQQWGCANPLYWRKTNYRATMVGLPYDDIGGWCSNYPAPVWVDLMQKVAEGFEKGCADWKTACATMRDPAKRAVAEKEYGIFRAAGLHYASAVDQVRFVQAREKGDVKTQQEIADRERLRAKEELDLVRRDSRIGYESSNHYFFVPQDLREKILSCRLDGCDESFSPAFFWWWNSKLDVHELCAQVDDFYEQGARTLCIHPFPQGFRPGRFPCDMTPDYLTDDYLDIYANVTDYAARKGMTCWFYDEGGWPSGGACGQVVASDPERFALRWMTLDKAGRPKVVSAKYNPAFQSSNPSVIEPGATEKFLELTHERVKTRIGHHFGKAVPWVFTDEPSAPHGLANLGWSTDFEREFKTRKGYDILPYVPALIRSQTRGPIPEDVKKVRIDYHEVMSQLFLERFVRPNRDWCRRNGLLYGGHFDGDDDMRCNLTHGHYHLLRCLREMDLPGVDCIWRQIHPDVDYTPLPRFASSAAHQTGAKRVLSETFAIYGETLSPDIMKRTVDFEMVRGVNQFVFAFVCQSTKKNFMSIGDPHFGKSDPKYAFMLPFNEYVRDTCARLAQGTNPVCVAVYYDVRAVWAGGHDVNEEGESAYRAQIQVAKGLDARQVDFDFIDDDLIEAGRIPYDVLVFPTNRHLTEKGKSALASFRARGGRTFSPDELDRVPRTCQVKGAGATSIRVTKRLLADGAVDYFLVNEDDRAVRVTVAFPEGPELTREFDPYGSEFVRINPNGTVEAKPSTKPVASRQNLDRGWTIRRTWSVRPGKTDFEYATYPDEPTVPCELGDWGPVLGTNFSGHATYRVEFVSRAAEAVLDLGKVGLCADARLNGQRLTPKFFGPFRWPVVLVDGTNVLEVTVGNSLAPALIPELPRIGREFPPVSAYAERERAFYAKDGLASGLIGPVVLNITR